MQPVDLSIFQKMWACTWQIREGSTVTNIYLSQFMSVMHELLVNFFFSNVEMMNQVISCKAIFSTYLNDP